MASDIAVSHEAAAFAKVVRLCDVRHQDLCPRLREMRASHHGKIPGQACDPLVRLERGSQRQRARGLAAWHYVV